MEIYKEKKTKGNVNLKIYFSISLLGTKITKGPYRSLSDRIPVHM
jgi:hypothetical protein